VPFVLLGVLTLGTGLAVGLGLSEGRETHTASSAPAEWTCTTSVKHRVETVNCLRAGEQVSVWSSDAVPKGTSACLTKALEVVPPPRSSEAAFEKALQTAESTCGFSAIPQGAGTFKHFFENPSTIPKR
jgi:hypothetical protein